MPEQPLENLSLKAGKNYAPLKPLQNLRDRSKQKDGQYLTDAVRERYDHYMSLDQEVWHDLISIGHLTSLFIQGKQNLKFNRFTKSFYSVPVNARERQNDKLRVTPLMRFYETNCESRYMSSNPRIEVIAAREDDRCLQAAKAASVIVEHYENKLYTNGFNRSEALNMMSFGTQVNQIRWNTSIKGWQAIRKIFETRKIPISSGVGQCFECGASGTGAEFLRTSESFPSCPHCSSFNAYAEPPVEQFFDVETRRENVNLGDFEIRQLEFPASRWDLHVPAEKSKWFIYEQMTSLGAFRRLFGNIELPEDKTNHNDYGLMVVESLARAGLSANGKQNVTEAEVKSALYKERLKLTEFYLSADDLTGLRTRDGGEETVCGETLPGNTSYAEIYPEGAYFVGATGFNILLGVYPRATHTDELTTGTWHARQHSGAGQGISDSVEINKRYNETDSQAFLAMKHNATPATVYAAGAIDKEYRQYLGNPDVAIPINFDQFDNIRSINDIIASPRVGMIDAGLIQYYSQNLHNMLQLTMHVTNFSGGIPGVDNKTATGAQIGEAYANSVFMPMLGVKTDVRVRAGEIYVQGYRKNVPVKQYFPLGSKFGAQNGVYLSGADLDKDLVFKAVRNSEIPKTQYTVRDDIDRFLLAAGGLAGAAQAQSANPKFFNEVSRKYNVEFEIDNFDEAEQISRQRFEDARGVQRSFAQIEQQVRRLVAGLQSNAPEMPASGMLEEELPEMPESIGQERSENLAPNPVSQPSMTSPSPAGVQTPAAAAAAAIIAKIRNPVSPYEDNHGEKAAWFSGFLDTDEGRNLSPELREVVYAFINAHFMAGAIRASQISAMAGAISTAGALPGQIIDTNKQMALAENKRQTSK